MIYLLLAKAEQFSLFDSIVHVAPHVRKDGTFVAQHERHQKVRQHDLFADHPAPEKPKPKSNPKAKRLIAYVAGKGGPERMGSMLRAQPAAVTDRLVLGFTAETGLPEFEVRSILGLSGGAESAIKEAESPVVAGKQGGAQDAGAKQAPVQATLDDAEVEPVVEAAPAVDRPAPDPEKSPQIVEHVTKNGKGKTLRGIIRRDLTLEEAKEIDPYAFRKDGGLFIREKHLGKKSAAPNVAPKAAPRAKEGPKEGERNADGLVLHAGRWHREDAPTQADAVEDEPPPAAPFGVPAGTSKAERRRLNAEAALLVSDKLPGEMTDYDLALLRQYSGNGGCGDSLNEFYTDPEIASAMWSVARRLGIVSGTALEPSCATGVFLHTAPAGFKVTGVELDPVSAKIAEALHGERHEIQSASLERFATQDMRQFDVVLGNPPYGPRGMLAKDDKKELSKAEEYFIDTSLDKTRAGGLCMLVVPAGIMDSKNGRSFRERMLRKAEFLGAQRMPNTAFEAAHTDVTADVIFLRKRGDDVAGALSTVDQATLKQLGVWDAEFLGGSYFEGRGAGNVFGAVGKVMRSFGEIYTVNGSMQGVPAEIATFEPHAVGATPSVFDIIAALPDEAAKNRARNAAEKRPYEDGAKVGDIRTIDGVSYVLQGNPPRWHRVDEALQTLAVTQAQGLAAEIDRLMTGKVADRVQLEKDIKAWVAEHGIPAKNPNLLVAAATDKSLFRLIGAVGHDGKLSDVVAGRMADPAGEGFDTIARALSLSDEAGYFTAAALAESLGQDKEEVVDRLAADAAYAYHPGLQSGEAISASGFWAPMDVYLTGELWPKLDAAKAALAQGDGLPVEIRGKLEAQAARLEETIDPKALEDVEIVMNSAFIPTEILAAFMTWRNTDGPGANKWTREQAPVDVSFDKGVYTLTGGNDYGDQRLLDKYLNRTGVRQDDMPTIEAMNEQFKDWLCASAFRERVEDLYNREFRGFVQQDFSAEPMDIPGLANQDQIKGYQWPGLRWALAAGKGIIAADVGLGKTLRGLLLARTSKMTGRAKKPIITVPKSVLANWYAETQKWFPGSRVLTIGATFEIGTDGTMTGRDDGPNERKRKYHDLSQNDYDFVIISEPAFEELDLDPIAKNEYYSRDFWVQRGDSLGNAGDKRIKKIRENYEQAIAKREFSERTDAIYFNEIGVDMLIADEMHHQKNLYAAKARFGDSPKFLGGQGLSNRALDFNLKARWLLEQNQGKGIFGLTATPTKNSPLEIYSMLSHIAPEAFERIKIRNSEEFLDRFCVFERDSVLGTDGQIDDALVTAGFKNLDELRQIMRRYIDRTTAEQVGLKLPTRDDHMHLVEMTPKQQEVYAELREMAEKSSSESDATGDSHIFSIMDKMNKAALDLEILDPAAHAGEKSPKYKSLAKHVIEGVRDGGQVVFADYVDAHAKIVDALVAGGIPREQIGVINAQVASTAVKRQNIADAFNAGKLKVVIGNTPTMGEGINLQNGTTDIHHMDLPWEPASMQQRNGRGVRQGNISEAVRIHTYMSKGSFDGYRYQSIAAKKDWQDLLWNGGDRVDNLAREGKFSREDLLILLSADPDAARAKFEGDKTLAMAKHEAGERVRAAGEFVRFQELSSGFKALKNKNTASAARLRQKLDAARAGLKGNRFFLAKDMLDFDGAAVVQPQTGMAFHKGIAFEAVSDKGEVEGKYVVMGVSPRDGFVSVRSYGALDGKKKYVKLSDLKHGVTPFSFDEAEEARVIAEQMELAAADKANQIKEWDELKSIPQAVLRQAYDSIQRQLRDGALNYSVQMPSDVPMLNRETKLPEIVPSYSVKEKIGTHDFLLPTDESKAIVSRAWMDEERGAQFDHDYVTQGRSKKSITVARKKHPGGRATQGYKNPWTHLLREFHGEPNTYDSEDGKTAKALRAKLEVEQLEAARHAKTMTAALAAVLPTGRIINPSGGHGATVSYSNRALAILWAKARQLGVLGDQMEAHVPTEKASYSDHHFPVHAGYAFAGRSKMTVHGALLAMAQASGRADLTDAIVASAERHHKGVNHREALEVLSDGWGHSKQRLETLLSLAEKAGVADQSKADLRFDSGILGNQNQWSPDRSRSVRQILQEQIGNAK